MLPPMPGSIVPTTPTAPMFRAGLPGGLLPGQGPDHFFFAVCLCKTVIGYIAFNRRPIGYEAGYCFDPAYHGKGYASESLSALMRLMQNRGVRKLTAGTAVENMPSVRLLTSLGFVLTGTEPVSFYADEAGRPVFFEGGVFEAVL